MEKTPDTYAEIKEDQPMIDQAAPEGKNNHEEDEDEEDDQVIDMPLIEEDSD